MVTTLATTAMTVAKRKPLFIKVKSIHNNGNWSSSVIARPSHIADCLIGYETGYVLFIAHNE
ncbi:unnamed protein product [Lupinus luteus]|uniref:Single-stranded DNA binding protein Ssb-like OB fold domain-containing protein n=1 Tax=Lupinus luteus TaxID=3873 RepID=A0AAV1YHZ6_LUPLU